MTPCLLTPRAARLVDGKWRAEVVIDPMGWGENVYRGGLAASEGEALEIARRLVAAATVELPVEMELPAAWK
jgi:hypothetical protein